MRDKFSNYYYTNSDDGSVDGRALAEILYDVGCEIERIADALEADDDR